MTLLILKLVINFGDKTNQLAAGAGQNITNKAKPLSVFSVRYHRTPSCPAFNNSTVTTYDSTYRIESEQKTSTNQLTVNYFFTV